MTVRSRLRISLLVEWSKESVSLLIKSEQLLWKHRHWLTVDRMTSFSNEIWATRITWNIKCRQNPSKHSSWWRRTEDVFSVTFFCLPRRLQEIIDRRVHEDVLKTSCKHVLKTSWETKKCYVEEVFKKSWRRLGKQEMFAGIFGMLNARYPGILINDYGILKLMNHNISNVG